MSLSTLSPEMFKELLDSNQGDRNEVIKEYDGNKYYVKVNPRVEKFGRERQKFVKNSNGLLVGTRGDCVIRALSLATGLSYLNVAKKLRIKFDDHGDVPIDFEGCHWNDVFKFFNKSIASFVNKSHAFMVYDIFAMEIGKDKLTVRDFARTLSRHKDLKDKYLIIGCESPDGLYGHAVFVKNGKYYDSWDSGDYIVIDVFDVTNERPLNAYDFRNIVQARRNSKKRYRKVNGDDNE